MAAMLIFALVMTAIYSTWMAIVRGTRLGLSTAANVQRSRVAMRTVTDAFLTVQVFQENLRYYYFIADASGDMSAVSMVSHLPASFPGVGRYGDQIVRRVDFYTQPGTDGSSELVMNQAPLLLATNDTGVHPYSLVLARDVSVFLLEYWDLAKREWSTEWSNTNRMPPLVRITLGLGKTGTAGQPQDLVSRIVAVPSVVINGVQRGAMGGMPPGMPPPGQPMPGQPMPGQPFPGQPYRGQPSPNPAFQGGGIRR